MSPELKLAKTLWGVPEADSVAEWDGLFARIKAEGFDGVEAIALTWRKDKDRFTSLLAKHGLALICQIHTCGGDVDAKSGVYQYCTSNQLHDHLASFVRLASEAKSLGAVMINSHSGHDSWGAGDKAVAFFKQALKVEKALGIPIVHETHRQRLLFSPYSTAELLARPDLADLKINADLSHWCGSALGRVVGGCRRRAHGVPPRSQVSRPLAPHSCCERVLPCHPQAPPAIRTGAACASACLTRATSATTGGPRRSRWSRGTASSCTRAWATPRGRRSQTPTRPSSRRRLRRTLRGGGPSGRRR